MHTVTRACLRHLVRPALLALCAVLASPAQTPAVAPGTAGNVSNVSNVSNVPGQFDYYLLDMPWGAAFCSSIKDVSTRCQPQPGFVVHGLWPQNNNGTWPQFCSQTPPPADLSSNLDITPDLNLLQHEWAKHGTCSGLGGDAFFAAEHTAFRQIATPMALIESTANRTFTPLYLLNMFYVTNPGFPPGSFSLSCAQGHVLAVEACFSKSLQPIACQGLTPCNEQAVTFDFPGQASRLQ